MEAKPMWSLTRDQLTKVVSEAQSVQEIARKYKDRVTEKAMSDIIQRALKVISSKVPTQRVG